MGGLTNVMSLRNVVKRITHKERAQPRARKKYGLLEKKKDYKLRAKDYHRKEDRLKKLKQQAAMRNPDEFYFGMIKATTTEGGNHMQYQPPKELSDQELQVLRTQDIGYLYTALQKEKKEIQQLEAELAVQEIDRESSSGHGEGSTPAKGKHTVFVDDEEELDSFSTAKYFDTPEDLLGRKYNRLKTEQLNGSFIVAGQDLLNLGENDRSEHITKKQRKAFRQLQRVQQRRYRELQERRKRAEKISVLIQEKQLEKNIASKDEKVRINDGSDDEDERPVYKWKAVRQR